MTVLLVSNGDHEALDEHLPLYLTQDYPSGYDVVVVAEKADLETENVLKRYSHDPRLYHTFVPDSSRYMSKNKLAITLGVKASKSDWIVLTDPRCKPSDSHWLSSLSEHFTPSHNMVLGYSNFTPESKAYHRFERLHTALYLLREAQTDRAYRTNCLHVSFRKSEFMERHGFLEHLKYSIGEYDFLVNKFATPEGTVVASSPAIPSRGKTAKCITMRWVGTWTAARGCACSMPWTNGPCMPTTSSSCPQAFSPASPIAGCCSAQPSSPSC